MRNFITALSIAVVTATSTPAFAEGTEKMEEVLIEKWQFFKDGDKNRDGFIDSQEFYNHPLYLSIGWKTAPKTFVWWMVDDNKDQKISLQEWFNNELGQFQIGDKNHDGFINEQEYGELVKVQEKLFADLNFTE